MRYRARNIILRFLLLMLMAAGVLAGCNPATRHRMLTFFFDGVPSLTGSGDATAGEDEQAATDDAAGAKEDRQVVMSSHQPASDCAKCHTTERQTGLPDLIKAEPELCYDCHADYTINRRVVHGPVAVGECLICHEPHKSRFRRLRRMREPQLCYYCHAESVVKTIAAHQELPTSVCTRCHDPHAGAARMLLKM